MDADARDTSEDYFVDKIPVFWRRSGFDSQECLGDAGRKCRRRCEGGGQRWWVGGIFFADRRWLGQIEVSKFQIERPEEPVEAATADFQEDVGLGEITQIRFGTWLGGRAGGWGLNCWC